MSETHDLVLPAHPRAVCVGHALKETLSAGAARSAIVEGMIQGGGFVTASFCVSDGGDGFIDAYEQARPSRHAAATCSGPLGEPVECEYLFDVATGAAVIETARCSGLALVPPGRRDIMASGTAGIGDVMADAMSLGAHKFFIGLGGSATCDGGIGLVMRLQHRLLGDDSASRAFRAADLEMPVPVRMTELRAALSTVDMIVCTDVTNPLTGPFGSAVKFAPQKGAAPEQAALLDSLLGRWADIIEGQIGQRPRDLPGAGAAGGLGFAFMALGGKVQPGAEAFCELVGLRDSLSGCDLVATCEGKFDQTSFHGKAPWRVAMIARAAGRRAVIACGLSDPASVKAARDKGVEILTFAADVPVECRSAEAAARLRGAIENWLIRARKHRASARHFPVVDE
ncbi:MAG: glycerate kinase [bacterium]